MEKTPKAWEVVWLKELARRIEEEVPIVNVEMMVSLRDKLPKGFKPSDIDHQLLYDNGPSIAGLKAIGDPTRILPDVDRGILYVQERLLKDPHLAKMTALELSERLGIPQKRAERVLRIMSTIGYFSTGGAMSEFGMTEIQLGREEVIAEYLGFESLEKKLEALRTEKAGRQFPIPTAKSRAQAVLAQSEDASQVTVTKANTAFVLMNMDPNEPALIDVLETIKRVCKAFGVEAFRIDDVEHSGQITPLILDSIRSSEFIIADLSGEKPNVYYEVGYAHAVGKRPILYRKAGTRLHFDLLVHNVPEYRNNSDLRTKLHRRLEEVLGKKAATDSEGPA